MRENNIELNNQPEKKSAALYDELLSKYQDKPIKVRSYNGKLETGWILYGVDSQKLTVMVCKIAANGKKDFEEYPIKLFEKWQNL